MSDIGSRLDKLSPKQRALYELLVKEKKRAPSQISRQPGRGPFPASFSQRRLWLVDQIEPQASFAYNIPIGVEFLGRFEVAVMSRCLREVVDRHESLRTIFASVDGEPVQVVAPAMELPFQWEDLTGLPADEQPREVERRMRVQSRQRFDLARGPLLRVTLFKLGEEDHVVFLNMHHLVVDRWSLGVLVRELVMLYDAFAVGRASPLPPLPIQYSDFARWQREQLEGGYLTRELDWWKARLANRPPPLELPTDRPRPELKSYEGARHFIRLPAPLIRTLKALSQREGCTLFMLLLTAFEAVLHRYTGATDLLIGSPIANRQRPEVELLIGFLVNTLVLRTDLTGDPTFQDALARVRQTCLDVYAHQDLPFEKLVEELQPERRLNRNPLFQVMFSFQNTPRQDLAIRGLTSVYFPFDPRIARFDLVLELREEGDAPDEVTGWFEYDIDLFDDATLGRMSAHLRQVLETVAQSMEPRLSALPLMGEEERRQVLETWNASASPLPELPSAHALFEAQARATPDAPAADFEGHVLSYAGLDAAANRLAHRLLQSGVRPEQPVAVLLPRGLDAVIALLACLKAGAAYLPLDAQHPPSRLRFVLQYAGARLCLTHEALVPLLGEDFSGSPLCLDSHPLETLPPSSPGVAVSPQHLAYIIYTSGSTGTPKGTLLQHQGLINTALAAARLHRFAPGSRVLQFASPGFDASVCEVFGTLAAGATLVLAPRESLLPDAPLRELLVRQRITAVTLTPSVLAQLQPEGLGGLATVISAGEALPPAVAERWGRGRLLLNAYGPTEVTVCASITAEGVDPTRLSIGTPWPNTALYVLDGALQTMPVGVPGELYVASPGLARGYLGRPDLTAERFVPHPFSRTPGARLYRTGDIVRWRSSGELQYLGRSDGQVKLRGYRIELGEVEAALLASPGVAAAHVLLRRDAPGQERLVAYVAPRLDGSELRARLRASLPEYMVPAAFVSLEALPLTASGKVDTRALPAPETSTADEAWVAPRTRTEQALAALWCDLLGVPRAGLHDSFFDLGGHSLLATRLGSRLRDALGVDLPVRRIFEAPTLEHLARVVDASARASRLPQLLPVAREGALPLSFAQQRLWFLDLLEPGSVSYSLPGAFELRGPLDAAALARSFEAIVQRHQVLRTTYATQDGQPGQRIHDAPACALRLEDLSSLPDTEARVHALAREDAATPFDLHNGPVVRATLLRLSPERHVLLLNMHHIASDGWSFGVLVRELAAFYEAFAQGQPAPLPPLSIQYADYAAWQRSWLKDDVLAAQVSYWKAQLSALPVLELPTDRPRPALQTYDGAVVDVRLPEELVQRLGVVCRQEGVTPFMVLLSALQVLLGRLARQDDVAVGTPIAGRNHPECEQLIGFFVNTLILRTRLGGHPGFRGLLRHVRDTTLDAFTHPDIPFEKLVEELRPQRDLSRSPLFQVMFALNAEPTLDTTSTRLAIAPLELEGRVAKFDLTLAFSESASGWSGSLEYNTRLFDEATARRMAAQYTRLLDTFLSDLDARVDEVSLLGEEERRQVLEAWNASASPLPELPSAHALFEAQARATPDAPAVDFEGQVLSYAQLDAASNRLAHRLLQSGVRPEQPVAVLLPRGLDAVVALLACLKTGAAYLPLDAQLPPSRLRFMLRDAGARLCLTHQALLPLLGEDFSGLPLCLDSSSLLHRLQSLPSSSPGVPISPQHLAYIIYTSGSTGTPKGTLLPHLGLLNLLSTEARELECGPGTRILACASPGFDTSIEEHLLPITSGATLVMASSERVLPGEPLHRTLLEQRIHLVSLTPGVLAATPSEGLSSLRVIISGGEACGADVVDRWARSRRFVNTYGPTEATVFCTLAECTPGEGMPSIGRPYANAKAYVLDERLRPVPPGTTGELYLSGPGLARGYLGRPELTAERFLPHPFPASPGERLYRTGDLARWQQDGTLAFAGRVDSQVKLRGYRIETGEVEAALLAQDGVEQAVAHVREDAPGVRRLVGYLVPTGSATLDVAALRARLKEHLPDAMVPSAFVVLERLPLTPNGKVDRRALPAPELGTEVEYEPPANEVEQQLASLWAGLLGVERVGRRDDFFQLGGHSLLAARLVSRMKASFGVELPLKEVFARPELAALAQYLMEARAASAGHAPLPTVPRRSADLRRLPLSFSQQRVWLTEQLAPGSPAFNIPSPVRLRGALDTAVLEACFTELLRRHESLRTAFHEEDGTPYQTVLLPAPFVLSCVDLGSLPPEAREAEAQRRLEEEARTPFDLSRPPLLRAALIRKDAQEHLLLLTVHHLVSDGWSMDVLVRELAQLYAALSQGLPSPLAELPLQFGDFAVWQRGWLTGDTLESQLGFWKRQLDGAEPPELPMDRPRPQSPSHRGATAPFRLTRAHAQALQSLCRQEGVTPFMVFLATLQALLARVGRQRDICIGTSFAGRSHTELEGLVGLFVNTLVLRNEVDAHEPFRALLRRAKATTLDAFAHPHLPFEELETPLVRVMLILQNTPASKLELPGLSFQAAEVAIQSAKFDLTVHAEEDAEGWGGHFEYALDLFDAPSAHRLALRFQALLERFLDAPDQRVEDAALLSPEERQLVLEAWNGTHAPFPTEACLHELFEAQALRTPQAPAVEFEGTVLTYGQLDARANQLARHLVSLGVGPEVPVALCLPRGLELVVALLGVLKAGGAYLPMDPLLPRERLALMLEDSGATVVLTHSSVRTSVPPREGVRTIMLDEDAASLSHHSGDSRPRRAAPENLAYLLYTSGSTGRPKGTLLQHQGVCNLVTHEARAYGIGPGSRVLQFASLSFDLSVEEIFTTLTSGGCLVMAPLEKLMPGEPLHAFLKEHRLTVVSLTPGALAATPSEGLEDLRTVISGGEAVSADVVSRWAPGRTFLNTYGPTEATVIATLTECVPSTGEPPIGRPFANTRAYVLDARLRPVPVGTPGELYLSGVGLARGYLGQPGLTAERFLPDPFSREPGARMYRTGDVARWQQDGQLAFVGRADSQVKIRGFRVELGEVEQALNVVAGVRQAVVLARPDSAGTKQLVAWVAMPGEPKLTASELRARLEQRLPGYMVPGAFVVLDALPLTANGKVDRKALPAPRLEREADEGFVPPRTDAERALAEIWQEVLGLKRVGARDNFFELGGHSLLATQVASRIRQRFGTQFPLRVLFEFPTLEQVAARLDSASPEAPVAEEAAHPPSVPIIPVPTLNRTAAVLIEGPLEAERLASALAALSVAFAGDVDLRDTAPEERLERCRRLVADEQLLPFPETARARRVLLDEERCALVVSVRASELGPEALLEQVALACGAAPRAVATQADSQARRALADVEPLELKTGASEVQELPVPLRRGLVEALEARGVEPVASAFAAWLRLHSGQGEVCFLTSEEGGLTLYRARVSMDAPLAELALHAALQDLAREALPTLRAAHAAFPRVELRIVHTRKVASWRPLPLDEGTGSLRLVVAYGGPRPQVLLQGRFALAWARPALSHFQALLEAALLQPEVSPREACALRGEERERVLVQWNRSAVPLPDDVCAHHLFERQAALTPAARAVEYESESLTYAQLDTAANQLAHRLKALGAGPEVRVGLLLERGIDRVVGMLGTLKAGAAFVPLDPAYPRERLDGMVERSGAKLLLTHRALVDRLSPGPATRVFLDAERESLAALPSLPVASDGGPENLAYVIFTSGSTGLPKPTALHHRGLCNTGLAAAREHGFDETSRVLQAAAFGFDAAVCEVFATLLAGGCVVLAPREKMLPGEPLRALLAEARITGVTLTPSVLAQLPPGPLPLLRTLISAGEACSPELVRQWGEGRTFLNAYGPTETTVCASITRGGASATRLTLGSPWPNTRLYVLDERLEPVPPGVAGELYIAGVGVARGYLDRPDLTAERFLPDAFSTEPGARLYRTGDRVRWVEPGELEYLGRTDSQVKVRGFRIELGEVEAALRALPRVREAVAHVRPDAGGQPRLLGWLVLEAGTGFDPVALRAKLRASVPEHLVPSALVALPALPLTANGKVAVSELPDPESSTGPERAVTPPRTETEQRLATLWATFLPGQAIGVDESFFDLGGHSLQATQVAARIRSTFGREVSLEDFFAAPTIEALARRLDTARTEPTSEPLPPPAPGAREDAPALSYAQQRLWFLQQLEPASSAYNLFSAAFVEGALDVPALARALGQVVSRHESLRTTFVEHGHQPVQSIAPEAPLPLRWADLTALPASSVQDELRRVVEHEARQPFDLSRGPLFRVTVVRVGPRTHALLLAMHHIVSDGWSMGVLMDELMHLYGAHTGAQPSTLPPLPLQYADYAQWQRQALTGPRLDAQVSWWADQLRGVPVLELPTDLPRPALASSRGGAVPVRFPEALSRRVRALCRGTGTTPFMVFLALFDALLSRYSGQDDLAVGVPTAGRTHVELERLIGFFVNTLVLRAKVDAERSFTGLLERVKEATLGAFAHQELPFDKLVEALQPERVPGRSPLFQVMFAFQNTPLPDVSATGLALKPLARDDASAKFDLTLSLGEDGPRFEGSLEYSSDLYLRGTAERMAEDLVALAQAVLDAPGTPLARLPFEPRALESARPPLVRTPRTGDLPVSFAQQRLWFLDQLEPGSAFYNIPSHLLLEGPLDDEALESALAELCRRHEALRATFASAGGEPVLRLLAEPDLRLGRIDLSRFEDAETRARALAEEESQRPFDLARGPLLRATLVRLSPTRHLLLLVVHHIICDAWSLGLLMRELGALYEAFSRSQPSPLPPLRLDSVDHAAWLRRWLRGAVLERQLAWWREQLAGVPVALSLPTDRPRPAVQTHQGAARAFTLSPATGEALAALCRQEGVTPFMVLLATWQVLLARHAAQEDVCVGTPIAGRTEAGLEGMVGFFVNMLVLRARLDGKPSFREVLRRVREAALGAYAHQDVPFERLVEALRPPVDRSRSPLFQVGFAFQQAGGPALTLPGLETRPLETERSTCKFDLTLELAESARGIEGLIEYSTALFEASTVERLARHYQRLLESVLRAPEAPALEAPLLDEAERHQVLHGWNDTASPFPDGACIHHLFERQAVLTPQATAVEYGTTALTYAQLDARANQLAHALRAAGVGPEQVVAVALPRGLELVTTLLGVLKAGGVWLPLDPAYPAARLAFMLEDSGAALLVTDTATRVSLPRTERTTLCLEELRLQDWPSSSPGVDVLASNLAYVIYTSGSSGQPKAALLQHRGLCNTALAAVRLHRFTPQSRVLQVAASSFDASLCEVFGTLLAGGTLVMAPRESLLPGLPLRTLLQEQRITAATLTPSVLAGLEPEGLEGLRTLISAGEALPPELARRWAPGRLLLNAYGPTEASICAAITPEGVDPEHITLGAPWPNTCLYVLDAGLRPVPVGMPGELYIAGEGLARGYHRRPDLTAERFLPHPFSDVPGARLYRTGDAARWLPGGELEFLGRVDAQVKLRGLRIELGEVESALASAPGVGHAAAVLRREADGDTRLAGYVVPAPGGTVDVAAVRDWLKARLPGFMVPSALGVLEALPLTPNGKVDTRALPAPDALAGDATPYVAPRDALEATLATAFEELLGISPVGAEHDFFALGGHSLLAMRLIARIQERTGRTLSPRVLFEAPTVAGLATRLREGSAAWTPVVPLQPAGSRPPLFCVHPIGGAVFAYQELARCLGPEQPVYGLEAPGLGPDNAPLDSIEALAALYVRAVREQQPTGPYHLAGWSFGAVVAVELARQLQALGAQVSSLLLIEPTPAPDGQGQQAALAPRIFAMDVVQTLGLDVAVPETLTTPEQLDAFLASLGGQAPASLRRHYDVLESHLRALDGWSVRPYEGAALVLRASDTEDAGGDRGWSQWLRCEVASVPGDHYSLLKPPHVEALAAALAPHLTRG
ncbi:non-ribosomal peptide synthase/polyketide synthase [Pyxidicoccus xibeiensis]|uniref:non-ribosomal peptide synthase/polyketide synthase n=1 Tax=Pyxidicoccus xibeiensis TaxID=2906759 RepID=UPI0020A72D3D|nr:non-ribosomal peptide synthetase [Pyxidicoccus xibeiensis]MCP3140924.1 non-ribosomal peptide synthase/polyketide synthase [Pyxidicoccus xibeiensis]